MLRVPEPPFLKRFQVDQKTRANNAAFALGEVVGVPTDAKNQNSHAMLVIPYQWYQKKLQEFPEFLNFLLTPPLVVLEYHIYHGMVLESTHIFVTTTFK